MPCWHSIKWRQSWTRPNRRARFVSQMAGWQISRVITASRAGSALEKGMWTWSIMIFYSETSLIYLESILPLSTLVRKPVYTSRCARTGWCHPRMLMAGRLSRMTVYRFSSVAERMDSISDSICNSLWEICGNNRF